VQKLAARKKAKAHQKAHQPKRYTEEEDREHEEALKKGSTSDTDVVITPQRFGDGTVKDVKTYTTKSVYWRSTRFGKYLRENDAYRRQNMRGRLARSASSANSVIAAPEAVEEEADAAPPSMALPESDAQVRTDECEGDLTVVDECFAEEILRNYYARWSVDIEKLVKCVRNGPNKRYKDPCPPKKVRHTRLFRARQSERASRSP
jgi:hypothetical protein